MAAIIKPKNGCMDESINNGILNEIEWKVRKRPRENIYTETSTMLKCKHLSYVGLL